MLLVKYGDNKATEVSREFKLELLIDCLLSLSVGGREVIDEMMLQFIGEEFMDFRSHISDLKIDLSIARWLNVVRSFSRHSNIHEVALRKIEVQTYYKIKPNEQVEIRFNHNHPAFANIDKSAFGLDEESLFFLYNELKLDKRIPKHDIIRKNMRRPVVPPISWGKSHPEYWRAFPTVLTLYSVACALCRINKDKYQKLLEESRELHFYFYDIYFYQMQPDTGP